MKKFAWVSCFPPQIGQSSVPKITATERRRFPPARPDSRAETITTRLDEMDNVQPRNIGRIEIALLLFDSTCPRNSGSLAGESFAAILERHPRYPFLRMRRHRAFFERCDDIIAHHIDSITEILHGLGFNDAGIVIYRSAALTAFRAARPSI
jgi:hypothetical protein